MGTFGNDRLSAGEGNDTLRSGDGNNRLYDGTSSVSGDGDRDKLYCGEGTDIYLADKIDFVDSSCEEAKLVDTGGASLVLPAGALLLGAGVLIGRAVIRRAL